MWGLSGAVNKAKLLEQRSAGFDSRLPAGVFLEKMVTTSLLQHKNAKWKLISVWGLIGAEDKV